MDAPTFRALGEPTRLRIVELLRTGPFSVGDIADALGLPQLFERVGPGAIASTARPPGVDP